MKRTVLLTILVILTTLTSAQLVYFTDPISGRPIKISKEYEIEGNPYLIDQWKTSKITMLNKREHNDVLVKFDLYRGTFYYKRNDSLYEFPEDVHQIQWKGDDNKDVIFRRNALSGMPGKYLQVLADGKIRIVKYHVKLLQAMISNSTAYGPASLASQHLKRYVLKTELWIVKNNQSQQLKYSSGMLKDLTEDKKAAMDAFVGRERLNLKKEGDFLKAVEYYNGL